jgi:hypothetical protein
VLVNGISAFADVDLPVRQKCIVEALSYVLSLMLIDRKLILFFPTFFCLQIRQSSVCPSRSLPCQVRKTHRKLLKKIKQTVDPSIL